MVFLDPVVNKNSIAMDPSKIEAVIQWPHPTNVIEVRSLLGLVGYYKRFVQGFFDIGMP